VKSTDLHPSEPWMLCALYNGHVHVMNYENQQMVKDFEVEIDEKFQCTLHDI
jgi:coatomer subunit beta'